jgi:hypothetical protein
VDFNLSKAIWNMYVQASQDPNASKIEVIPKPSENSSPVGAALEYVGNQNGEPHLAQAGESVILGASNKKDAKEVPDFMRFKNAGQYFASGVKGGEPNPQTGVPELTLQNHFQVSPEALSASDLRKAIRESDIAVIKRYFPEDVSRNEQAVQAIMDLLDVGAPAQGLSEILIKMVEEELFKKAVKINEGDLDEITTVAAVQGAPVDSDDNDTSWDDKATKDFNKKEKKRAKLRGTKLTKEQLIQKVMDYLLTQGIN